MVTKLIKLTDFVFYMRNQTTSELCKSHPKNFILPKYNGDQSDMIQKMLAIGAMQWILTGEYTKFLKQPLKLHMFVPCDANGNPMEDISNEGAMATAYYQEAKEKVLFKGFEWNPTMRQVICEKPFCLIDKMVLDRSKHTVEDLLSYKLILSETALKQIYG